jgi:hypothetical protein
MSAITENAFFQSVKDPIYQISSKPVSVDSDTIRKATRTIPATANGVGTLGAGQTLRGKRTVFDWSNGTTSKMRWDTTCLEVDLRFTLAADVEGTLTPIHCSPSWNMFGRLIDQIKLNFNGSGVEIYSRSNGQYLPDFTARMLRYYTVDQLEKMDDFIFAPILDEQYIWPRTDATRYGGGYSPTGDAGEIARSISGEFINLVRPFNSNADVAGLAIMTSFSNANPPVNTAVAAPVSGKFLPNVTSGALERYRRYCFTDRNGVGCNYKTCRLRIPFGDLFPKFVGVLKNLRNVHMEIQWTDTGDILEKIGSASAGFVNITQARVITDDYILSQGQSMENLSEKMAGEPDNIAFLDPVVQQRSVLGNDIIVTSQRNIDTICVLQLGHQVSIRETASLVTSCGQFFLLNSESSTDANRRITSESTNTNQIGTPDTVQVIYGDITYPNDPIELRGANNHFSPQGLYYEYLKSIGKLSDRLTGQPIPRAIFNSTMPFIMVKPFSNSALKMSESKDVIIRFGSVGNLTQASSKQVWVVLFTLTSFRINVDGSVSTMSAK